MYRRSLWCREMLVICSFIQFLTILQKKKTNKTNSKYIWPYCLFSAMSQSLALHELSKRPTVIHCRLVTNKNRWTNLFICIYISESNPLTCITLDSGGTQASPYSDFYEPNQQGVWSLNMSEKRLHMCCWWRNMVLTRSWTAAVMGPQRSSRCRKELELFFFKIWRWKKVNIYTAGLTPWPCTQLFSLRCLTAQHNLWHSSTYLVLYTMFRN